MKLTHCASFLDWVPPRTLAEHRRFLAGSRYASGRGLSRESDGFLFRLLAEPYFDTFQEGARGLNDAWYLEGLWTLDPSRRSQEDPANARVDLQSCGGLGDPFAGRRQLWLKRNRAVRARVSGRYLVITANRTARGIDVVEMTGVPTDLKVRVDGGAPAFPIDRESDESLLARYLPVLRYDARDPYRADAADIITQNYRPGENYSNYLIRAWDAPGNANPGGRFRQVFAAADPGMRFDNLTLDYLSRYWTRLDREEVADDAVDEADNYEEDAQRLHDENPQWRDTAYGRVKRALLVFEWVIAAAG